MKLNLKIASSIACVLGALAIPHHANAVPVTVDFTITSTEHSSGDYYQPGVVGSGFFTFDDALMPAGGTGHIGNPILGVPTLDLAFDWFGVSFDETNAGIAVLQFAGGALKDWWIGGTYVETSACPPFARFSCMSSAGTSPDFSLISDNGGGSMNDGLHNGFGAGYGTIEWSVRSSEVPEPASLALFGLGLGAISFARRKGVQRGSKVRLSCAA